MKINITVLFHLGVNHGLILSWKKIYLSHVPEHKKVHNTIWEPRGERRYSSYPFTISAVDGGEGSASRPGRALAPRKALPVSIGQEAEWAPEPV
jgi:hypothetical protein